MDRPWLAQDMVWMLGSLCRINRIPFDPALVVQQHPPPHSAGTFIEAATALGFKIGQCDTSGRKPSELAFPFVALLRSPNTSTESATAVTAAHVPAVPAASLTLVIKVDGERLLYFRTQSSAAETIPVAEFAQHFEPVVLLVAHQVTAEQFAQTINQLKGKVTMLFIAHNLPRNLQVDEVFDFGAAPAA